MPLRIEMLDMVLHECWDKWPFALYGHRELLLQVSGRRKLSCLTESWWTNGLLFFGGSRDSPITSQVCFDQSHPISQVKGKGLTSNHWGSFSSWCWSYAWMEQSYWNNLPIASWSISLGSGTSCNFCRTPVGIMRSLAFKPSSKVIHGQDALPTNV